MDRYLERLTSQIGEEWRTDEVYTTIRGKRRYVFAMLDRDTRY